MIYYCNICEFSTENRSLIANHKRWEHIVKYYDIEKHKKEAKIRSRKRFDNKIINVEIKCPVCNKNFFTKQKIALSTGLPILFSKKSSTSYKNNFCCRGCANKQRLRFNWSVEAREKQSKIVSKMWESDQYVYKQATSNRQIFSSKKEREIVSYFIENFQEDEWTFGSIGKFKGKGLSPDMWSRKLKIIFEYDGIWHFKDIHGQLENKKLKDRLTEEFAIENGYRLVRVEDLKESTIELVYDLIYNHKESIIKFGNSYK